MAATLGVSPGQPIHRIKTKHLAVRQPLAMLQNKLSATRATLVAQVREAPDAAPEIDAATRAGGRRNEFTKRGPDTVLGTGVRSESTF